MPSRAARPKAPKFPCCVVLSRSQPPARPPCQPGLARFPAFSHLHIAVPPLAMHAISTTEGPPVRVFAFVRPSPSARVGPRSSAIRWPLRRAVQTLSILARTPRGSRPLQAPYMRSTRFLASARPACLAVVDRRRPVS